MMGALSPADGLAQSSHSTARIANGADMMNRVAKGGNHAEIKAAAKEFEAIFLSEMIAPIFENLETDGLFGGGSGERMYRGMLVQEYGRAMAEAGGVGVAEAVEREMLKLQEINQ